MKLLLDTHAALWWLSDDARFGTQAAAAVADPTNVVLLSAVVAWEIAIKRSLGKLEAPDDLVETLQRAGAVPLAMSVEHAAAVEHLPLHHRDPFHRALVAQALVEGATIVSGDRPLREYDAPVLW